MSQRASQRVNTGLCLPPLPTINSAMFVCVKEWTLMRAQREGGKTKTTQQRDKKRSKSVIDFRFSLTEGIMYFYSFRSESVGIGITYEER